MATTGVAALLALGGCGGGSPSRATWARQADAVCRPALERLRGVRAAIDGAAAGQDPDAIFARTAGLLRQGAGISRASIDRIEVLERPAAADGAIRAWIAARRRQAALTTELARGFEAQDETRIARLVERVDALDARNDAAARGLGLHRCGERVAR